MEFGRFCHIAWQSFLDFFIAENIYGGGIILNEYNEYDLQIEKITNVVSIITDRNWKIDNLIYKDTWILSYSLGGEAIYKWDDQVFKLTKGDLLFFQEGVSRSAVSNPERPWSFIVIKFQIAPLNSETQKLISTIPLYTPQVNQTIRQLFLEVERTWRTKRVGYIIKCKSLLYSLLFALLGQSEQLIESLKYKDCLVNVLHEIENNLEKTYTVKQLAEIANFSPSYFNSIFKKHTGFTPIQYQNYIKMTHAYEFLKSGNYRVSEVAELVGINNECYFSRLFKGIIGASPTKIKYESY